MVESSKKLFRYYKNLGDKAMLQLDDADLFKKVYDDANSIGIIVKHLWGNMLSRWTDFLVSDGEKSWRERDAEFEDTITTRDELKEKWEEGWSCLFSALESLGDSDGQREVTIRGEKHSVDEAILRQLGHYAYHVGQIVFIARNLKGIGWTSLSIPKGASQEYNASHTGRIKGSDQSIWEK